MHSPSHCDQTNQQGIQLLCSHPWFCFFIHFVLHFPMRRQVFAETRRALALSAFLYTFKRMHVCVCVLCAAFNPWPLPRVVPVVLLVNLALGSWTSGLQPNVLFFSHSLPLGEFCTVYTVVPLILSPPLFHPVAMQLSPFAFVGGSSAFMYV